MKLSTVHHYDFFFWSHFQSCGQLSIRCFKVFLVILTVSKCFKMWYLPYQCGIYHTIFSYSYCLKVSQNVSKYEQSRSNVVFTSYLQRFWYGCKSVFSCSVNDGTINGLYIKYNQAITVSYQTLCLIFGQWHTVYGHFLLFAAWKALLFLEQRTDAQPISEREIQNLRWRPDADNITLLVVG